MFHFSQKFMVFGKGRYRPYCANMLLIWLGIIFYKTNSFYSDFLGENGFTFLLLCAVIYAFFALLYFTFVKKEKIRPSKGLLVFRVVFRFIREIYRSFATRKTFFLPDMNKEERVACLFALVKFLFLPLMVGFVFGHIQSIGTQTQNFSLSNFSFSFYNFNHYFYPLLFDIFFFVDTVFFLFGYLIESEFLQNKVRSVEPTLLGWVVALACYPPFNDATGNLFGWYASDFPVYFSDGSTFFLRLTTIILLFVYVAATVALGMKSSNLTNRGIVMRGPYAFVRHPAYISKNVAWWISALPIMSPLALLSLSSWSFIYFMRAITEERHLVMDPEYKEYIKKVPYKFIPKVW